MNFARLIELRGRAALWLAELMLTWGQRLRAQSTRDLPQAVRPDDLLNHRRRGEG